ncbi:MAG: hypothetical protein JST00_38540 [Deltaproteobacteria bacterium]|nr:hypothetical protein [Deltaproteobacteria bacterium]
MSALDRVVPTPRLLETDEIELALPVDQAWNVVRHADFGKLPIVRALFTTRTLPERVSSSSSGPVALRFDELSSTREKPGFQVLVESEPREFVVGAIGKVWHLNIPFVHVDGADAFAAFAEEGFVKVAWAIQLEPRGEHGTLVRFEVRVDATDERSWRRFERYFAIIGPASRFIRRAMLSSLAKEHGTPASRENVAPLAGDNLLPDAEAQITHGIEIHATPEAIWPWLVQMGLGRGGFYSVDAVDNLGARSAREVHPELQRLHVGDVIPADSERGDGFEVLAIVPNRALILGGLWDATARQQLPFDATRPDRFWHVTWAFVLEPIDATTTRLHVRARAAFPKSGTIHAAWIRPVHGLMETTQLRHLAARVEGKLPADDWRDVFEGIGGVGVMVASFLTPFLRGARSHWGIDEKTAKLPYPGDALVPEPRWSWTHAIEIEASATEVWPWIVQLGADRGGFYSYQWLENLAGCKVRNAESTHRELALREGSSLVLHPDMPAMDVVSLVPERAIVAFAPADEEARRAGKAWVAASWAFVVEPQGEGRCRLVSRYRVATSDDVATLAAFGPTLLEPIGFAMDRRMLLGIKGRAERTRGRRALRSMGKRRNTRAAVTARRSP